MPLTNIFRFCCKLPNDFYLLVKILLTGLTAASAVYGKCIHIEAFEKLMADFDMENNCTPSLARGTNSHDHTYQVRQMQYLLLCALDELHMYIQSLFKCQKYLANNS